MSSAYRTVFFLPDPALGWRIPVAALVRERGVVRVGIARLQPDDGCVGGPRRMALLRAGLDTLAHADNFERLPPSIGPHFGVEDPREVRVDVEDVVSWVIESVLPTPIGEHVSRTRGQQRATVGYRFFESRHVAKYVRKKFHPTENLRLNGAVSRLHPISHWVPGSRRLLLLEPVITSRKDWEQEIDSVVNVFFAYRSALLPTLEERSIETDFVAYLVGGGHRSLRHRARNASFPAASRVVDVHDDVEAAEFIAEITEVGKTQLRQAAFFPME